MVRKKNDSFNSHIDYFFSSDFWSGNKNQSLIFIILLKIKLLFIGTADNFNKFIL